MEDGTGVTTYTYKAAGQLGAGAVASVDGPLTNDTITYDYDVLGRMSSRAVNGRAVNGVALTYTFDALGRVTAEANALGTFTYGYDVVSARLASVTYPNGQTSSYSYYPNGGDRRLQTIHHQYPNGTTLSKFDYTYSVSGDILTWRQQADATAVQWEYVYDLAGQLLGAEKWSTGLTPAVLSRYAYAYDPSGNRTSEQIDDQVTGASYDSLNRLVSQQPSGPLVFAGTTNEPSTVTVQGKPAVSTAGNGFRAPATVTPVTSTVTVTATDPSGNVATQAYEVDSVGTGRSFTYDANGNLTSDGNRTFEWDAQNQLVAVNSGTHRSDFSYDGLRRRVRMVDKENGVVQNDIRVVWCEKEICEERGADGATVTRRAFKHGEQIAGVSQFCGADHLGSITKVTNSSATVLARYAFDPWGRRTVVTGNDVTTVGYTSHRTHDASALALTMFRGYDPALARWVSEDPASHIGGLNLYGYVVNNPIRKIDPYGLAPWDFVLCWWYYGKCEKSAKKCAADMRQCDMAEVMSENKCASWGACVVKKCFVENPDCEKAWKYCGQSTVPAKPPGTR